VVVDEKDIKKVTDKTGSIAVKRIITRVNEEKGE
jgi:hypothetical protein